MFPGGSVSRKAHGEGQGDAVLRRGAAVASCFTAQERRFQERPATLRGPPAREHPGSRTWLRLDRKVSSAALGKQSSPFISV